MSVGGWVNLVWRFVPYYFGYTMLIYFAEKQNLPDTGWTYYICIFFFILVVIVNAIATLLIFLLRQKGEKK